MKNGKTVTGKLSKVLSPLLEAPIQAPAFALNLTHNFVPGKFALNFGKNLIVLDIENGKGIENLL